MASTIISRVPVLIFQNGTYSQSFNLMSNTKHILGADTLALYAIAGICLAGGLLYCSVRILNDKLVKNGK